MHAGGLDDRHQLLSGTDPQPLEGPRGDERAVREIRSRGEPEPARRSSRDRAARGDRPASVDGRIRITSSGRTVTSTLPATFSAAAACR
jgi:hypothetical protein